MNLNPRDFKPRSILSVFATVIALGMWRKMPPLAYSTLDRTAEYVVQPGDTLKSEINAILKTQRLKLTYLF